MSRNKVVPDLADIPPGVRDQFQRAWERLSAAYRPEDPGVDADDPAWLLSMAGALRGVADAAAEIQMRVPQRSVPWRLAFATHLWANEKSTEYEMRATSGE